MSCIIYIFDGPKASLLPVPTCKSFEVCIHLFKLLLRTQYEVPESIRAQFGISDTRNAAHGSDSEISSRNELAFFFPEFDINKW